MSHPLFACSIGSYWTEGPCWRAGSIGNLPEFEELGAIPLYRPNYALSDKCTLILMCERDFRDSFAMIFYVLSLSGLARTSWARGCWRKAWYTGSHSLSYFNPSLKCIWVSSNSCNCFFRVYQRSIMNIYCFSHQGAVLICNGNTDVIVELSINATYLRKLFTYSSSLHI